VTARLNITQVGSLGAALQIACTLEARLRLYSVFQELGGGLEDASGGGLLDPNEILIDSAVIENVTPLLHSLVQLRVLLVLGSTVGSSNVNETALEELSTLVEDVSRLSLSDAAELNEAPFL